MPRQALVLAMLTLLAGCAHHPLHLHTSNRVTTYSPPNHSATPLRPRQLPAATPAVCDGRIALIDVDGLLLNRNMMGLASMGENPVALFREKLERAAADPLARALVLRINSPGGGVTASDIMRRDLMEFRRRTGRPVVACIMDVGAGGAYYLATACDVVMAHPTSITGGVGVILNLYNLQDTMAQFNILPTTVRSGDHIDLGSPLRTMEPEARDLLQRIADQFHARFQDAVVESRTGVDVGRDDNFDGRIFTAPEARDRRLIDDIGYLDDALALARQLAGCDPATPVALYRRANDRALTPYDVTANVPLQNSLFPVSIPGLDRSQLPTFLYLWQTEPLLEKTGGS